MPYTVEEREQYRRHKALLAHDRLTTAQGIIKGAYYKAHPRTFSRVYHDPLTGEPAYLGKGPRDGIVSCGHPITHADIHLRLDVNGHEYHDHKRCNSWACPVCGPKMANKRADEIAQALMGANKMGYKCLFLTFTVPHRKSHSSAHVMKVLDGAYNKMLQARAIRDMKEAYGFVGQIKCRDFTLGDNGTHAHLHCIWILDTDRDILTALQDLCALFVKVWDRQVYNVSGQHVNRKHGFDIEYIDLGPADAPDVERVARYAAKAISVYMADNDKDKGAAKASKTPYELLNSDATEEDRALYLDFYKGQKGKRHIMFSRGLKDLLGVQPEGKAPADSATVAYISYENAYYLRDEKRRQTFETMAKSSVAAAVEWLHFETVKEQAALGNYNALNTAAEYIVPDRQFIQDLDGRPLDEWAEVVRATQRRQEVEFPEEVEYAFTFYRLTHNNNPMTPEQAEEALMEREELAEKMEAIVAERRNEAALFGAITSMSPLSVPSVERDLKREWKEAPAGYMDAEAVEEWLNTASASGLTNRERQENARKRYGGAASRHLRKQLDLYALYKEVSRRRADILGEDAPAAPGISFEGALFPVDDIEDEAPAPRPPSGLTSHMPDIAAGVPQEYVPAPFKPAPGFAGNNTLYEAVEEDFGY